MFLFVLTALFIWCRNMQPKFDYEALYPTNKLQIGSGLVQIHPFLAEFKRYIFLKEDGRIIAVTPVGIDPGGNTRINLYRINDDTYITVGSDCNWYFIDLKKKNIRKSEQNYEDHVSHPCVGWFDWGSRYHWQFIGFDPRKYRDDYKLKGG